VPMDITIMQDGDKWVAVRTSFDPRSTRTVLATGETQEECVRNLEQWKTERDAKGLTPADPVE
jgi:hypothetical protein